MCVTLEGNFLNENVLGSKLEDGKSDRNIEYVKDNFSQKERSTEGIKKRNSKENQTEQQ